MKNLIVLVGLCLTLLSCGPSLSDVKVGMTEPEVEKVMGTPNHKSESSNSFTSGGIEEIHSKGTWEYDGQGKIEFEDGVVIKVGE